MKFFALAALMLFPCATGAQQDSERILKEAIALHQAGNTEQAIIEYRAYLKQRPDHADARSNLGAALASTGRYREAIAEYRGALKGRPKDPSIRLNLALAYYKMGEIRASAGELVLLHAARPRQSGTMESEMGNSVR